jgi:DNA-binding LytR/AlgR family response regulator
MNNPTEPNATSHPDDLSPAPGAAAGVPGLRVLTVDDEAPALSDLVFVLESFPAIREVVQATDATSALRSMRSEQFDAVFLDVRMPGLDGIELARVLQQFRDPPHVVFVTAFESYAVEAFEIAAIDYVVKPVRRDRIQRAIDRIVLANGIANGAGGTPTPTALLGASLEIRDEKVSVSISGDSPEVPRQPERAVEDPTIAVETAGRIRFIHRDDVQYVASSGDYVRLHTAETSFLYRSALANLEERWTDFGFVRIHRSYLVSLRHIDDVRIETGRGYIVRVGTTNLPVSRRMTATLRQRLYAHAAAQRP